MSAKKQTPPSRPNDQDFLACLAMHDAALRRIAESGYPSPASASESGTVSHALRLHLEHGSPVSEVRAVFDNRYPYLVSPGERGLADFWGILIPGLDRRGTVNDETWGKVMAQATDHLVAYTRTWTSGTTDPEVLRGQLRVVGAQARRAEDLPEEAEAETRRKVRGRLLRLLREARDTSIAEAAGRAGKVAPKVTVAFWTRIESGAPSKATAHELTAMASALGTTLTSLYTRVERALELGPKFAKVMLQSEVSAVEWLPEVRSACGELTADAVVTVAARSAMGQP